MTIFYPNSLSPKKGGHDVMNTRRVMQVVLDCHLQITIPPYPTHVSCQWLPNILSTPRILHSMKYFDIFWSSVMDQSPWYHCKDEHLWATSYFDVKDRVPRLWPKPHDPVVPLCWTWLRVSGGLRNILSTVWLACGNWTVCYGLV